MGCKLNESANQPIPPSPPPLVLTGLSIDGLGNGAVDFECWGLPEYMAKYGRAGWLAGIGDERPLDYAFQPLKSKPRESGLRVTDMVVAYYLRLHHEETQTYFRAVDYGDESRDAIRIAVKKRIEAGDLPTPVYLHAISQPLPTTSKTR